MAVLYLLGRPPVINLSPLWPSPESRSYRRALRSRLELSDAEFVQTHFPDAQSSDIPIRVRKVCASFNPLLMRVKPTDCLQHFDDEFDLAWLLQAIEKEFRIRITGDNQWDGRFGSLVALIHAGSLAMHPPSG